MARRKPKHAQAQSEPPSPLQSFAAELGAIAGNALDEGLEQADRFGFELERRVGPALELADRVERLGPVGLGVLAWNLIPKATRESMTGDVCAQCDEPRSRCECCDVCGFSPCACDERFAKRKAAEVIEVEGEALD